MLVLLAVGLAARIGQPDGLAAVLGKLKDLEGRTENQISTVGKEMASLKADALFQKPGASSFLETGATTGLNDHLTTLQGSADASLDRLRGLLTQPLSKQLSAVEEETSAKVDALLAKAKVAMPSSLLETELVDPDATLEEFNAKLKQIEKTTETKIKKAGWKPSSFLEEDLKAAGKDKQAAKAAARAAERAADHAKIEAIFAESLANLKQEAQAGAKQLVQMHQQAIDTGRAEPGDWNPFDSTVAEASSLIQTGEVRDAPTFATINQQIRQIEVQTKHEFDQYASSFVETGKASGQHGDRNKAAALALAQIKENINKVWEGTNATIKHYDAEFEGTTYEPTDPVYTQMHHAFADMKSQFAALKSQVETGIGSIADADKRLKAGIAPADATSLLQIDAPSFAALKAALLAVQRMTLARAVEAKKFANEVPVPDAYDILGLDKHATGQQLAERYATLRETLRANPIELALVKRAYLVVKHAATHAHARASHKMQQQVKSHQRTFQVKQAGAILGLGEIIENEVQQRYHELRALEAQEDKRKNVKPRKTSAVMRAYKVLADHHQFKSMKKALVGKASRPPMPVEDAKAILGVTEATPPRAIRQRFLELKDVLLGKHAPTAVKLRAMHEIEDAYISCKNNGVGEHATTGIEVTAEGQLRKH